LRDGPIELLHNGDTLLARCCYALVRATRPATVVETGVAHGVTSAYILAALRANGDGVLHSIDLPPHNAGAADRVGAFVDASLRPQWQLHRGWAHKLLPPLATALGTIDMFVHDSLHTYRNMKLEFDTVWPCMRDGAVVIADDVEGNSAFLELNARAPRLWGTCRQADKPALFGVVVR
jgi:predicted O-methyltransferase YrrM